MADSTADPPTVPPPSPPLSDDDTEIPLTTLFEPNEECICDFGDIILNADDGFHPPQKLRVSSCILAMSSKVFKALFSKKFAEGQAGAGRSSERPHEVLVEDSPIPFKQLCRMLHHLEPYQTGDNLSEAIVPFDLAQVADKYDTVEALRVQFEAMMGRCFAGKAYDEDKTLEQMVATSLLLGQQAAFQRFTREMVMRKTEISNCSVKSQYLDVFPPDLVSSMRDQQYEARQMLTTKVMELVQQFSRACKVTGQENLLPEFLENLKDMSLMPPDFKRLNLRRRLRRFSDLDIPIVSTEESVPARREEIPSYTCATFDYGSEWGQSAGPPRRRGSSPTDFGGAFHRTRLISVAAPTHKTIRRAVDEVERICQGECWKCIQGKDCSGRHYVFETTGEDEDKDSETESMEDQEQDWNNQGW